MPSEKKEKESIFDSVKYNSNTKAWIKVSDKWVCLFWCPESQNCALMISTPGKSIISSIDSEIFNALNMHKERFVVIKDFTPFACCTATLNKACETDEDYILEVDEFFIEFSLCSSLERHLRQYA